MVEVAVLSLNSGVTVRDTLLEMRILWLIANEWTGRPKQ